MSTLQPTFFLGIGHTGYQVLRHLKRHILSSHGALPVLRWLVLDVQHDGAAFSPSGSDDLEAEEMFWIPWHEPNASCLSRVESQQAFRAHAEELVDLIRQAVPTLTSYEAVAAVEAAGLKVADSPQVAIYVLADLGDPVGGGLAEEVAYLVSQVCRQQGREPRCAGVFFLPDAAQAGPVTEANAYTALKELDAHLADPSLRRNGLPHSLPSVFPFDQEARSLFDRGCYLLDTVNEQAYTVSSQVLVEQAARWLYGMSVMGLYHMVDDIFDHRFARRTIRRKVRVYGSFGLAGYTLPIEAFRDWCAARLGQAIVRQGLLGDGDERLPAGAVEDFVARTGLRVPDLSTLLRVPVTTVVSEKVVQYLCAGSLQELENRLRGALRQIREVDLPRQQQQVQNQIVTLGRQVSNSLAQKLLALMRQSSTGAIVIAREFLNGLDTEVARQEEVLARQEGQYSAHRHQVIAQASRLSYQLKTALMSLTPRSVLILTTLGGLLLPVIYWLVVLFSAAGSQGGAGIRLAWPLLLGGVGVVVAYYLWTSRQQSQKQCEAYIEHLHTRAELELAPVTAHAASALYQQVRANIRELAHGLRALTSRLAEAAERMAEAEQKATETMADQARPGPWQSLLTPSLAEQVYSLNARHMETHLPQTVEALGSPGDWATCSGQALTSRILAYALDWAQGFESLRAKDVLRQQSPSAEALSRCLTGLLHRAAPQCAFNTVAPSHSRVPSRVAHVLILDGAPGSELSSVFTALSPDARVLGTGNARTVMLVSMRWGLPAFALRRLDQYWAAYAGALRRSDASMHVSPRDVLLPEPVPEQVGLPGKATLFAVALGLGLIDRDVGGPFSVKDASGQTVSLGNLKEPAAVLLGRWPGGARALHRAVRATVASLGGHAAADRLQRYLHTAADLTGWERQAIQQFMANLS